MGQYYCALVKRGDKVTSYNLQVKGYKQGGEIDYDKYNGVKLMEHSYWGNDFMCAITGELYHHRARVAWVGDYASDYKWGEDKPNPKELFEQAWSGEQEEIEDGGLTLEDMYLVNHTKKIFISGNEYWDFNRFKWGKDTKWSCTHPLSLLTACGNGLGGGDYWEDNPDANLIGDWCMDEIEVTDTPPKGYKKVMYDFCEKGLTRNERRNYDC